MSIENSQERARRNERRAEELADRSERAVAFIEKMLGISA